MPRHNRHTLWSLGIGPNLPFSTGKVFAEILNFATGDLYSICYTTDVSFLLNPLRAAGEKGGQYGTSSSHGGREKLTEKHQPISEGKSWEPRIVSSHTGPQKTAKEISFHVTTNEKMVAEQV